MYAYVKLIELCTLKIFLKSLCQWYSHDSENNHLFYCCFISIGLSVLWLTCYSLFLHALNEWTPGTIFSAFPYSFNYPVVHLVDRYKRDRRDGALFISFMSRCLRENTVQNLKILYLLLNISAKLIFSNMS